MIIADNKVKEFKIVHSHVVHTLRARDLQKIKLRISLCGPNNPVSE